MNFRREEGTSVLRGTALRLNYLGSCKALGILGIKCFVGSTRHCYECLLSNALLSAFQEPLAPGYHRVPAAALL